jgi:hypothetical protein
MGIFNINIDKLLESTTDLTSDQNSIKSKQIDIDLLLELTREC